MVIYLTDTCSMKDPLETPDILTLLPGDRPDKIRRCSRAETRKLGCAAGLLLAAILPLYDIDPESVRRGPHGRPISPASTDFNLSHSGEGAALAVSGHPVGCDLERVRAPRSSSFARRYFSAGEQAFISRCTESDRPCAFFRIWTARESYLKLTGEGLTVPLHSFEVVPETSSCQILRDGKKEDCRIWQSSLLIPESSPDSLFENRYVLSAASSEAETIPRIQRITVADLVSMIRGKQSADLPEA